MTRPNTIDILTQLEEGALDKDTVIRALLAWMSDDEVGKMAKANEFFPDDEIDVDSPMDGDHDSAMASAGWGTDEDYGYYSED